eukprot:TRINITY_DN1809_c0_g1_i1.p1 TRINITY_DN1809_c0_g1~~TRINITY_DN1809_c0_g1_i1.p1  ORF type:complete len:400 (-),score=49.34 TRINITY_DN1809_c0_g1_i1:617-1816(-)
MSSMLITSTSSALFSLSSRKICEKHLLPALVPPRAALCFKERSLSEILPSVLKRPPCESWCSSFSRDLKGFGNHLGQHSRSAALLMADPLEGLAYTEEYYKEKGIVHNEGFITNSRGMKLFTSSWVPASGEAKALVFLLHGYAVDSGLFFQSTASRFAAAGYAVFGIDYEGHGRSEGLRCYIKNIDDLVDDCNAHFKSIRESEQYRGKARFLCAQSLGGAVALLLHRKYPDSCDGAILLAPMVKISDKLKPPPPVTFVMKGLAKILPTWPILPTSDVLASANRDPKKLEKIRANPYTYTAKPRLGTGLVLLNAANHLESTLDQVTCPYLLLHGEADSVTDPAISRLLYEKAQSTDKTFNLFPGMWHDLTEGELDENVDVVYEVIFAWLDPRVNLKYREA